MAGDWTIDTANICGLCFILQIFSQIFYWALSKKFTKYLGYVGRLRWVNIFKRYIRKKIKVFGNIDKIFVFLLVWDCLKRGWKGSISDFLTRFWLGLVRWENKLTTRKSLWSSVNREVSRDFSICCRGYQFLNTCSQLAQKCKNFGTLYINKVLGYFLLSLLAKVKQTKIYSKNQ